LYGRDHERVVLIGDGIWDIRVAAHLGWSFLGVGLGERRARLERAGANVIVENFSDARDLLELLRTCGGPKLIVAPSEPPGQLPDEADELRSPLIR
jgi:hypothetical protein